MKGEGSVPQTEPVVTPAPKPAAPPQEAPVAKETQQAVSLHEVPKVSVKVPPLMGGISIKTVQTKAEPVQHITVEVKPLTEEDLSAYWKEAGESLGLQELLAEGVPHLGEQQGRFEVDAQSVSFAEEFKPHKIDVMEFLRGKTGMKMLDCKVNPLFVSKDEVVYSPEDKYKAMAEQNPQLAELRKLFPIIDY